MPQNTGLDLRSLLPSLAPSLAFCCASRGARVAVPACTAWCSWVNWKQKGSVLHARGRRCSDPARCSPEIAGRDEMPC